MKISPKMAQSGNSVSVIELCCSRTMSNVGVGSALIYSGWQAAPGREELLALGFTMVLIALVVLSLRYLF